MKAFNIVLSDLNNGVTHTALTADFHELVQTVQSTGRAGREQSGYQVLIGTP